MGVVIAIPERQPAAARPPGDPTGCVVVIFPGVRIERGLPPDPATSPSRPAVGTRPKRQRRAP